MHKTRQHLLDTYNDIARTITSNFTQTPHPKLIEHITNQQYEAMIRAWMALDPPEQIVVLTQMMHNLARIQAERPANEPVWLVTRFGMTLYALTKIDISTGSNKAVDFAVEAFNGEQGPIHDSLRPELKKDQFGAGKDLDSAAMTEIMLIVLMFARAGYYPKLPRGGRKKSLWQRLGRLTASLTPVRAPIPNLGTTS